MPTLKTRRLFISHAWRYDEHYEKLVEWFDDEPNFSWMNYSVPSSDSCDETTKKGLKTCLTRQINPSQCVIILAGMWAAYSDWIEYEISEAQRLNKIIIGVRPWRQQVLPKVVTDAADTMVSWQKKSIIDAIREYV